MNPSEQASARDLQRALEVREAIRDLLLANNDIPGDPAAIQTINRDAAESGLLPQLRPNGQVHLETQASGVSGAIGRLVAVVLTVMTTGVWTRLKACQNDDCQWAFYDRSKNQSGKWCDMTICGNLAKVRAYRRRNRGQ